MSTVIFIIGIVVGAIIAIGIAWWLQASHQRQLKLEFGNLAQEALRQNNEQFLALANERLDKEQTKAMGEFKQDKQVLTLHVQQLKDQLAKYEKLIKDLEKDRAAKFSSLDTQLQSNAKNTENLLHTTEKLTAILANVKLRGQWGERMAEDILNYCGLQEGLHFDKNTAFETNTARPDYIFHLPDDHKLAMDVKFPLNNYLAYVNAENEDDKERYKKDFLNDVKARINEIAKKEYLPAAEATLDYVLLFIPNEQVYGFVNENYPGLIDESLGKKIIICSPWTLYAVLRIVWQAWQNYHYSQGIKDVVLQVKDFLDEFDKFRGKMDAVGKGLSTAQGAFEEMVSTRTRKLDSKIEKIQRYGEGQDLIVNDLKAKKSAHKISLPKAYGDKDNAGAMVGIGKKLSTGNSKK